MARIITPRVLSLWGLAAFAGTITGPFGTYSTLDWEERSLFWGCICASSVFVSGCVRELGAHLFTENSQGRREAWHVCAVSFLMTPLVYGLVNGMGLHSVLGEYSLAKVALFVFLFSNIISALRRISGKKELLAEETSVEAESDPLGLMEAASGVDTVVAPHLSCRLMDRLPAGISGEILHLSARDHFVDVALDGALVSLRMRFSDAVTEMDGIAGFSVHRSHWVAEAAIEGIARQNAKMFLVLKNDQQVPVSRAARSRLEEAGILQRFAS
jgi:hypothetical protein